MNGPTYFLTTNKFSDWTATEVKKILGYKPSQSQVKNYVALEEGAPSNEDVDWRKEGKVTPVKD